ncbi:MAG: hypothetical protein JOZ37_03440 [Actinobacteria bacterium]|nr:hypothetical protein [Actinomycetota bacterium]
MHGDVVGVGDLDEALVDDDAVAERRRHLQGVVARGRGLLAVLHAPPELGRAESAVRGADLGRLRAERLGGVVEERRHDHVVGPAVLAQQRRQCGLVGLHVGRRLLDVEVEVDARERLQHLSERGEAELVVGGRLAPVHVVTIGAPGRHHLAGHEPVRVVELEQLGQRQIGDRTVVDERFVDVAHANDIAVHVWTIDDAPEMERLLALGVDGIMTDKPSVLADVLSRGR